MNTIGAGLSEDNYTTSIVNTVASFLVSVSDFDNISRSVATNTLNTVDWLMNIISASAEKPWSNSNAVSNQ
jgi:hypothetical protein